MNQRGIPPAGWKCTPCHRLAFVPHGIRLFRTTRRLKKLLNSAISANRWHIAAFGTHFAH